MAHTIAPDTGEQSIVERAPAPRPGRQTITVLGWVLGLALVVGTSAPALIARGWQPLGPILGIALVVFSLFGDLPPWISWLQRLGSWLFIGVMVGTVILLVPLLRGTSARPTSLVAFSPAVWGAYLSIIAVGLTFEVSALPGALYRMMSASRLRPDITIPIYIFIAGLLGNIFDGVTIIAISVVIFLSLLERKWAFNASFALLFGGLVSNLITVAAEPTNIKFQDVLGPLINHARPDFWATNWPISVLGILVPAIGLFAMMKREDVAWKPHALSVHRTFDRNSDQGRLAVREAIIGLIITLALAAGIIAHSIQEFRSPTTAFPLWLFLLPAGVGAVIFLWRASYLSAQVIEQDSSLSKSREFTVKYLREQVPVWGKIAIIFSLLWYLSYGLAPGHNALAGFFGWPKPLRYGLMVILSLLSSVTDNVALAAMQGALIVSHPLAVWQIRLLLILLTWAGGLTYFGCLQSLALNSRLKLATGEWLKTALLWSVYGIIGALAGLLVIFLLYPQASGLVR